MRFSRSILRSPLALGGVLFAGVVFFYAWLAFVKLSPDALYSGDMGVKYVQAESLARNHFHSLDISYPGASLDPEQRFVPMRPPFVMNINGHMQAIFSPMTAILDGLFVARSDYRGMILVSWLSAVAVLWMAWRLAGDDLESAAVPVILGLATPWWFYGVVGWEHAPAVAFSTIAFFLASRANTVGTAALAGLALGVGASIRDEVLLLAPGLAFALWLRLSFRATVAAGVGALAGLASAAAVEVYWFHRPLAAHLLHAVHLVRRVAHVAAEPNPDVPSLEPLSWFDRYDAVIGYWLIGYPGWGRLLVPLACAARWLRWRLPVLVAFVVLVGIAALDAKQLVSLPHWVAGLYRLSPFLVFVLLPSPAGWRQTGWLRSVALCSLIGYLVLAILGTDTIGGKSMGPRLLLPLVPILVVAAWQGIVQYVRAPKMLDRCLGWIGVALVVVAFAIHVGATIRAYADRSDDDGAAVKALRTSKTAIIVADDFATAQLLLPLYFQKVIFLADTQALADELAASLTSQQFGNLVMVSRRLPDARFTMPGFRKISTADVGRMTLEEWHR